MKIIKYEAKLKDLPSTKIYLNVNYLKKGEYILKIISKNKTLITTTFKKK